MKFLFFLIAAGWVSIAQATVVPTGDFDCSLKKGSLLITLTNSGPGTFMQVHRVVDQDQTTLQGFPLIAFQKRSDGTVTNLIRLPESNVELFFDEQGHLGLESKSLDCRRL